MEEQPRELASDTNSGDVVAVVDDQKAPSYSSTTGDDGQSSPSKQDGHLQHNYSRSQRWTALVERIRQPATTGTLILADYAAHNPWKTTIAVVILTLGIVVTGLFTNFQVETDLDIIFTPVGSVPLEHSKWLSEEAGFPAEARSNQMMIHADGGNVLTMEGVSRAFDAMETYSGVDGYEKVCAKTEENGRECEHYGVTMFWNNSRAIFEDQVKSDQDVIEQVSELNFPDGRPVTKDVVFGLAERNETSGLLVFAPIFILNTQTPDNDEAIEWEYDVAEKLLDMKDDWEVEDTNVYRLEFYLQGTFGQEFFRSLLMDIPLIPVAFGLMSIFAAGIFAKSNSVQSQALLGFGCVAGVLCSILTGFGICFIVGVPFTSLTTILPFIIVGIGLDDGFIIYGEFCRSDKNKSAEERIHDTIHETGASIFLTTMTTTLAFSLALISSIPAVDWLVSYAFPTIIVNFLYSTTFFVALIVIDEKRKEANRVDCCVCFTKRSLPSPDDNFDDNAHSPTQSFEVTLMTKYTKFLMIPAVKTFVIIGFLAMVGLFAWRASLLVQAFDFRDLAPSDSYINGYFDAMDEYTVQTRTTPEVVFRDVDQSIPEIQTQMKAFLQDLVDTDYISNPPYNFWLTDFEKFTAEDPFLANATFQERISAFLENDVYDSLYWDDIVIDETTGDILESRTTVLVDNISYDDVVDQIDALRDLMEVSAAQPINEGISGEDWRFFTYSNNYLNWDFYSVCVEELIQTTWLGIFSVTLIAMFLIPHWSAAPILCLLISMLYVDLLGVLQIAGLAVNSVSYITLVVSIGLMVDFVMHVLLRYYEARGTREEKVLETMTSMGVSIAIGAFSTFLGTLPLAWSSSEILVTVFTTFVGLVTLGAGHGLILLPVVLSLIGTEESIRRAPPPIAKRFSSSASLTKTASERNSSSRRSEKGLPPAEESVP